MRYYCGSEDMMDAYDRDYDREEKERADYEARTPLTRSKAVSDMEKTEVFVWGSTARYIELMAYEIAALAKVPVR